MIETGASCSCEPLFDTLGLCVRPQHPAANLRSIRRADIQRWYRTHGALLVRGFASSVDAVADFAGAFLTDAVVNGNTAREDVVAAKKVQTVNTGNDLIPLHAEMAYGPMRPDLLVFYCMQPPKRGSGETLLCDGVAVWNEMASSTKRKFEEQPVRFTFRCSVMLGSQCRGYEGRVADDPRVTECRTYEDGTMDLTFVVPAAPLSRHGGVPAFANSVIVERDSVSFDDGTPIDDTLRRELFVLTTSLAHKVVWEAGDILFIDNSRVMHGRRQIAPGDNRRIVLTMGWEREVQHE